jgi:hypothetical protein
MRTVKVKEWKEIYAKWKENNPHLADDSHKVERRKLVKGCKGKALYLTYSEAMRIVCDMPAREGRALHAYQCPICTSWHIGNTSLSRIGVTR